MTAYLSVLNSEKHTQSPALSGVTCHLSLKLMLNSSRKGNHWISKGVGRVRGVDCGRPGQTSSVPLRKVGSRWAGAVLKIFIIHSSDMPDGLWRQTLHYVTDCARLPSEASQSFLSAVPVLSPPGLNILMVLFSRNYFRQEMVRIFWGSEIVAFLPCLIIFRWRHAPGFQHYWFPHVFHLQNELGATKGPVEFLCVLQHLDPV